MAVDTPSNASTAKTLGTVSSLLRSMFVTTTLYACLTIAIASTIPSPRPVGLLVGFWGSTTGSTWIFLLLGFFSTAEHTVCHCRAGLWIAYVLQIFIGAAMVLEPLGPVDLHSISDVPSMIILLVVVLAILVILAILAILAFLGYVIDLSYVIATTQSGTGEDDVRFLTLLGGWILAFSHTVTEAFPMQRLGAEGSQGNFQSWLFRMFKMYRRHQVRVQEDWEMDHLLSDMEEVV
ncbi:hypothetical protein EV363DRAFT_1274439 [Boletus edulis]|nr:hypothetical protein EV363DRAFT_1274439 [Boletus edulis]